MTEQEQAQSFVHKSHGWLADLSHDSQSEWIEVRSQSHENDPCAGQNLVISALYRACELMDRKVVGEVSHSGGYVRCKVVPVEQELA